MSIVVKKNKSPSRLAEKGIKEGGVLTSIRNLAELL